MPNFWTKAGQLLSEAVTGSKTKDIEFKKAKEKMKQVEEGMNRVKNLLKQFMSFLDDFNKILKEINEAFTLIYSTSPYASYINEVVFTHSEILECTNDLSKDLDKNYKKTSEWDKIFDLAKSEIKERDEKRMNYDHYEQKLTKLNSDKKIDQAAIQRNEDKFTKAATEYITVSERSFKTINDSIKKSYELVNPVFGGLVLNEMQFFIKIWQLFNDYYDPVIRLEEITKQLNHPNTIDQSSAYDPSKYMNDKDLFKIVSINRTKRKSCVSDKIQGNGESQTEDRDNKQYKQEINMDNVLYLNYRLRNAFGDVEEKYRQIFMSIKDDFDN